MNICCCDAQLNFGTLNDVLCWRSYENFNGYFPSIALEKVSLKERSEYQQTISINNSFTLFPSGVFGMS